MAYRICLVNVVPHPVYGRVLEASQDIGSGEDIIRESPLILVDSPQSLSHSGVEQADAHYFSREYAKLTPDQRGLLQRFESNPEKAAHHISTVLRPEVDHFRRVLHVNGHAYGTGTTNQTALFEHISFARHSCASNSVYNSVAGLGVSRLIAAQDLKAGDMVSISYIANLGSPLWPRWRRKEDLANKFAFDCTCARCSSEEALPPSVESVALSVALERLDSMWDYKEMFLKTADAHVKTCASSSDPDKTYHLFCACNLVREFHMNHYRQSADGDTHLLPGLEALAILYELLPVGSHDVMKYTCGSLAFVFSSGLQIQKSRPGSATLRVVNRLWNGFGGLVRDAYGKDDPDYFVLAEAFGSPSTKPVLIAGIIVELRCVKPCAVCGLPVYLHCGRCRSTFYCLEACQRTHWKEHKNSCQAAQAQLAPQSEQMRPILT